MPPRDEPHSTAPNSDRSALAREHLANERTFLAWIRTSLALTGFGFAVAKFGTWITQLSGKSGQGDSEGDHGLSVGIAMIIAGGVLAVLAAWRHRVTSRQIESGTVKAAGRSVLIITLLIVAMTIAVAILVLMGGKQ